MSSTLVELEMKEIDSRTTPTATFILLWDPREHAVWLMICEWEDRDLFQIPSHLAQDALEHPYPYQELHRNREASVVA